MNNSDATWRFWETKCNESHVEKKMKSIQKLKADKISEKVQKLRAEF